MAIVVGDLVFVPRPRKLEIGVGGNYVAKKLGSFFAKVISVENESVVLAILPVYSGVTFSCSHEDLISGGACRVDNFIEEMYQRFMKDDVGYWFLSGP